jgi:hypothetical protein
VVCVCDVHVHVRPQCVLNRAGTERGTERERRRREGTERGREREGRERHGERERVRKRGRGRVRPGHKCASC